VTFGWRGPGSGWDIRDKDRNNHSVFQHRKEKWDEKVIGLFLAMVFFSGIAGRLKPKTLWAG